MRRAVGLLLFVAGCWENPGAGPPLGYENDIESCHDGRDNDRDGRTDCADTDCVARSLCNEVVPDIPPREPDEDNIELCTNRIDDDDDGNFDCGDRTCGQFMELCCSTEFTNERCSNGIDDDDNGYTDCEDFGCSAGIFVTVCDRELVCDDGRDNDNDGRTDMLDSDCAVTMMGPEDTVEACSDEADNDGDGYVDCNDFDCSASPNPEVAAVCMGGVEESTPALCMDEVDNDANGFTDCNDFGCSRSGNPEILAYCAERSEDNLAKCTDGIDNDGDGYTDCDDNSCVPRGIIEDDLAELADVCESSFSTCTDGIDNDRDGFADCADFSCRGRYIVSGGAGSISITSPCIESAVLEQEIATIERFLGGSIDAPAIARANCSDGMDNDADGFVDCDDWDCNWNPLIPTFCEERTGILICR